MFENCNFIKIAKYNFRHNHTGSPWFFHPHHPFIVWLKCSMEKGPTRNQRGKV